MFNYRAYELGGKKPYQVTQIRDDGNKKYVAFNGSWHEEKDCVVCAGTGILYSDKKEIYEGDVIQLNIPDYSCWHKGEIGIVRFAEGRFCWSPINGFCTYSLAGKCWKKIGNIAHVTDIDKYYTSKKVNQKSSIISFIKNLYNSYSKGVFVEKYKAETNINEVPFISNVTYIAEKQRKTLLHQYKNYLKIKGMIEAGELDQEIMNSNLL